MDRYLVDDDFLYKHVESAEDVILDSLPREEDLAHKFSNKFNRKMNKLLKEERRSPSFNRFVKYARRAAVICMIALSLVFATTMSIEALRVRFFEKVVEVVEDYTSITFHTDEDVIVEALEPIVPGYVPEAFSIYEEETHSTRNTIIYRNHKEEEITYSQVTIAHSQFIFDTEGVELQYVDIGKQRVNIFTNKGLTQLYWDDEKYMYIITSPIGRHEIIKMAESIIESNK